MTETNIPKIIHYCWFGNNKKPKKTIKIIKEWEKKLPDYKFIEWNEQNFDISKSCNFVKEAYYKKKWAFVSDYVRLYALREYGGIYLDTDVQILKKFDEYLDLKMFISQESDVSLCTAVIGAEKENKIISGFLNTYEKAKFIENNKSNETPNSELIKNYLMKIYGPIQYDLEYTFDNIKIFPQTYFCGKNIHNYELLVTDNTVCIHNLDATWYSPGHKLLRYIKKNVLRLLKLFKKD